MWNRSGLADAWFAQALGTGILAAEANSNLDGVLALFTAATRFVERQPDSGPSVFLEAVLDAEVPEDTLSPRSGGDSVLVTTPSGAIGLEFEVVALLGVQDGIWPNLRPRGSLLYPQEFARVDERAIHRHRYAQRGAARRTADVRARRLARPPAGHRLRRGERRRGSQRLLRAAADGCGELRSGGEAAAVAARTHRRLRRELVAPASAGRGAPGGLRPGPARRRNTSPAPTPSSGTAPCRVDAEPLFDDDEPVPVSPSKLELFEESPLDWFVQSVSGSSSSTAMGIGTIVHWAMETATDPSVDALAAAIESRWNELVFESPWLAEQQRRAARTLARGSGRIPRRLRRCRQGSGRRRGQVHPVGGPRYRATGPSTGWNAPPTGRW